MFYVLKNKALRCDAVIGPELSGSLVSNGSGGDQSGRTNGGRLPEIV
jgi:hypothetical protein